MTDRTRAAVPGPVLAQAGIGLRSCHHADFRNGWPPVAWLEVHSENFFADGGPAIELLEELATRYPISLHGVGLSLGSTDAIDLEHVHALRRLKARVQAALISEHLCWASVGGRHLNDLLPLPFTQEALAHLVSRIALVQDLLGTQILIENVSSYVEFSGSQMPEWEFLTAVADRSGCGILLDINNVYVSATNHGFEAETYLDAIPAHLVRELHLAGHDQADYDGRTILVDTHGTHICDPVWALFERVLDRIGPRPTLIEWDTDIPDLDTLLLEAAHANQILERRHGLIT